MKLPNKITYKFYGMGIPKRRAVKFLTLRIRTQKSHIENNSLFMTFTGNKKRHAGILLVSLVGWLRAFCNAKSQWLYMLEESETV